MFWTLFVHHKAKVLFFQLLGILILTYQQFTKMPSAMSQMS